MLGTLSLTDYSVHLLQSMSFTKTFQPLIAVKALSVRRILIQQLLIYQAES